MFKTKLQIEAGKLLSLQPTYAHVKEGEDHDPRFKATVTLGKDKFESPNFCRTLKEAQNSAAEVAYRDLTQRTTQDATSHVMHKNMLQEFATKHGLGFPEYSSIKGGSIHRPQFKSSVKIDGQTYHCEEWFNNVRSAGQAAAAVALEALSKKKFRDEGVHKDFDDYKNLLAQKAQKEGLQCPKYESTPSFMSRVYFMGSTYEGAPAESKKEAEKNAAKVAWDAITYGALTPASALISGNTYSQLSQNAVSPASIQRISSSTSGIRLVHAEAPRQ
eukprot:TRINITY_DN893_c0_g1_i4.p1 TRINITY_DN893_c0_g1~~TRINITY_DN893_c0_g1_i4.p1  ORF type:complete len:274 (+),score=54.35 TRINITY_DN893_c0_g1_i4:251-1072(+)